MNLPKEAGGAKMFDNLRGVLFLKFISASPEDFFNALNENRIPYFDASFSDGGFVLRVYRKDFAAIKKIAKKQNVDLEIVKKKGLIFKAIKYKKRFGMITGVIFAVALVIYMSNIALKIEISGNKTISEKKIMDVLNENGIYYGAFIPNMDFKRTEKDIITAFDKIAWVGIRRNGGRVIVEIDELTEHVQVIPFNVPCNIVSDKDAQIIGAKVYKGSLVPKVGEGVKKGDILISGISVDRRGKTTILHAQGTVIGRYKEKMVFEQKFQEEKSIPTGDEIYKRSLFFFGLKIPLYLNSNVNEDYEYDESENNLSFFNITLPIGIRHEEYRPLKTEIINYTPDEAKAAIEKKISDYEENFLKDEKIISKETQFNLTGEEMKMVILYTLEGEIGVENKIFGE